MTGPALSQTTVDSLEAWDGSGFPVLSVYLPLGTSREAARSNGARAKDLLKPLLEAASDRSRSYQRSLQESAEWVVAAVHHVPLVGSGGVALFGCPEVRLRQRLLLPAPVRERAVVDSTPYTRPLRAMMGELHGYCAAVLDRRSAHVFRFQSGELSHWEQVGEEEVRKSNFGGFAGYEERRVRAHADEVARRHYRLVAARVDALLDKESDLLLLGGPQNAVESLRAELSPEAQARVGGTFAIDINTLTPAQVQERCTELAAEWDAKEHARLVADVLDLAASGGQAAVGVDDVLDAVSRNAVDVLVVETDVALPGTLCPACGAIGREDPCRRCGSATEPVPDVVDAAAQLVRDKGGRVRHIFTPTPLSAHHLAARLRF